MLFLESINYREAINHTYYEEDYDIAIATIHLLGNLIIAYKLIKGVNLSKQAV